MFTGEPIVLESVTAEIHTPDLPEVESTKNYALKPVGNDPIGYIWEKNFDDTKKRN